MYLVKSLGNATAPDMPGNDVQWTTGQTRYVHESLIQRYWNNPAAWEIVATPDYSPVVGFCNPVTGLLELSAGGSVIDLASEPLSATGLIADNADGFAIDTTVADRSKMVQQAKNSVISFSSIESAFPGVFTSAKLIEQLDGTLKYSPHNLFLYSDDITVASWVKTGATVSVGVSSCGDNSATTLTASATTAHIGQVAPSATHFPYRTAQFICKAGTTDIAYIEFYDTVAHRAYFNLTTGATGTIESGVTASISALDSFGVALPAGYYRIVAGYRPSTSTPTVRIGLADADGSVAVTIAKTIIVEYPHLHFGLRQLEYYLNSGATAKYAPAIHPTYGMLLEINNTFTNLWSDDLTNAAWTKSNATAELTATGPDSEPCTTLTATDADGTAIQTTSNAYSAQTFSAYIKRRTGTGAVFMTTDNGATWVDVSAILVNTKYTRAKVPGVANPTIGFKLATSGDAIDIAKANCGIKPFLTSPVSTYSTTVVGLGISSFSVPKATINYDGDLSLFVEWCRGDSTSSYESSWPFSLKDTAHTKFTRLMLNQTGQISFNNYDTVATGASQLIYNETNANAKLSCSVSIAADRQAVSMNGDPPLICDQTGIPPWTSLAFRVGQAGDTSQFYLKRVLVIPEAVDVDDLRTWKWGGTHPAIVDCRVVNPVASVAGTNWQREPSIGVLNENESWADFAVVHMQKRTTGHHSEAPARLVQKNFRFVKSTGALSALTESVIVATPDRFSEGLGHLQSASIGRAPVGANAGKFVLIYTQLDSPQGTFSPDERNIYMMVGNGDPNGWGGKRRIISASQVSSTYIIGAPGQNIVVLPPTHAVAPNRMIFLAYVANGCYGIYSDDGGDTWSIGNKYTNATYSTNEPALVLCPDGSLIATHRSTTSLIRTWSISTDGGITFVDQGAMDSDLEYACNAGIAQLDPTGKEKAKGVIATSRVSTLARVGLRLSKASGPGLKTYNTIYPWNVSRSTGYSALASIFGGTHLILASEAGLGSDRFSVQVCVIAM